MPDDFWRQMIQRALHTRRLTPILPMVLWFTVMNQNRLMMPSAHKLFSTTVNKQFLQQMKMSGVNQTELNVTVQRYRRDISLYIL